MYATPLRSRLLILDGDFDEASGPGPVARSVIYRADGHGYDTAVRSLAGFESSYFDELAPALVIIILDHSPSGTLPVSWSTSSWRLAAQATTAAVRNKIQVLAMSSRGAGALAACVSRGAGALFGLGEIDDHLGHHQSFPQNASSWDRHNGPAEHRPPGFDALLTLTDSERRVLFYLTGGWSAQAIADELVVSLTTVRSHIRSTLRKLGVRSQLAAVAIANGLDFESIRRPEQAPVDHSRATA